VYIPFSSLDNESISATNNIVIADSIWPWRFGY